MPFLFIDHLLYNQDDGLDYCWIAYCGQSCNITTVVRPCSTTQLPITTAASSTTPGASPKATLAPATSVSTSATTVGHCVYLNGKKEVKHPKVLYQLSDDCQDMICQAILKYFANIPSTFSSLFGLSRYLLFLPRMERHGLLTTAPKPLASMARSFRTLFPVH